MPETAESGHSERVVRAVVTHGLRKTKEYSSMDDDDEQNEEAHEEDEGGVTSTVSSDWCTDMKVPMRRRSGEETNPSDSEKGTSLNSIEYR